MVLVEGNLQFDFDAAHAARRFDDESHGLSHCMKAIDFVVETKRRLLFIEIKDPQDPNAQKKNREEFLVKLRSETLIQDSLVPKCRDSFIYEYCFNRVEKPITYLVLVALDSLSEADLLNQTDSLKRQLPVNGPPSTPWPQPFVQACIIMNLETWKKHFPEFPIQRTTKRTP